MTTFIGYSRMYLLFAAVAELADAHGSGPCESNFMGVRFPSAAPESVRNVENSTFAGLLKASNRSDSVLFQWYKKEKRALPFVDCNQYLVNSLNIDRPLHIIHKKTEPKLGGSLFYAFA